MTRYAMVINVQRCVGCHACEVACRAEWGVPDNDHRTWVKPTYPTALKRGGGLFELVAAFYVGQCNHCEHPTCVEACPTGATYKREDGIVVVDHELCIGCGYCVEACPYGARYVHPTLKKVDKCDFCAPRLEKGLQPACVETCITGAKVFGDLDDPTSEVYKLVFEEGARGITSDEVNLGPNVYYVGDDKKVDLIINKFPPRKPKLPTPASLWEKVLKPLIGLGVIGSFVGASVAYFVQLFKGEEKFE